MCILGKAGFEAILLTWPHVALKIFSILTRDWGAGKLVENSVFYDGRYRVLHLLAKLAQQCGAIEGVGVVITGRREIAVDVRPAKTVVHQAC